MAGCVFCAIAEGKIPSQKVLETPTALAFLDINPISDGHTLIIPKAHYERLDACPPAVLADVMAVACRIAPAVKAAVQADAYNLLCNNGSAAGQVVEHVHFHFIPRKSGDGVFNRWPAFQYPAGKAQQIADAIRRQLG